MNIELLKVELEEFGFVVVKDLMIREKAERLTQRVMEVEKGGKGHASGDTVLNSLDPSEYELFLPLIHNPVILELAGHMLGPNFKLCGDIGRVWSKPGDAAQGLHADLPMSAWFGETNRPIQSCPTLQVIWTLTDFTKENGATQVLPFSHFSQRVPREINYDPYLVSAEATAGSAIVMHGSAWHRRGKNHTQDQHRIGISVPYIAQWLDPVSVGWRQIKKTVRDQFPTEVQRLFPHLEENSIIMLGSNY